MLAVSQQGPLLKGGGRGVITRNVGLWQLVLLVLTLVVDAGTKHRFCCDGEVASPSPVSRLCRWLQTCPVSEEQRGGGSPLHPA